MKLCVLCALALLSAPALAQTDTTLVRTPSGSTHGALVNGNVPCAVTTAADASGRHTLGDCNLPASHVSTDTNTQTLSNKSISGSANTLSNVPDAALSSNVDLLNAAQSTTALKSFTGGLALPSTSNPTGSNFYVDSSSVLHFVNSHDWTLVGACFIGDCSRPYFQSPLGSGISETSSGQAPNFVCDRNDFYNGGSGLGFCINTTYDVGKGFTSKSAAYAASGSSSIVVTPNANIAVGYNVYGPGIATGTMVSSYSSGTVGLSLNTVGEIQSGSTFTFISPTTSSAPTSSATGVQSSCNVFSIQLGSIQTCSPLAGYSFKLIGRA